MRLLILTQKVNKNDQNLGFFHQWIKEFSRQTESVLVICLEKGEYDLPPNVKVLSLGKEAGVSKLRYLSNFYKYIWRERNNYDAVFVHMNPEYVTLGSIVWKLTGKRVGLWYTHRKINLKLRLASIFVDRIFTASKEGFGIKSSKTAVVGHGIDLNNFVPNGSSIQMPLDMVYVGRITRIKHIETMLGAIRMLLDAGIEVGKFEIAGSTITPDDISYKSELEQIILEKGLREYIVWNGAMLYKDLRNIYANTDIALNASPTGGMDKTVLESWVSGRPAFASNEAFKSILGDEFVFTFNDPISLSNKIQEFLKRLENERKNIVVRLSQRVRIEHSLESVVTKILGIIR